MGRLVTRNLCRVSLSLHVEQTLLPRVVFEFYRVFFF